MKIIFNQLEHLANIDPLATILQRKVYLLNQSILHIWLARLNQTTVPVEFHNSKKNKIKLCYESDLSDSRNEDKSQKHEKAKKFKIIIWICTRSLAKWLEGPEPSDKKTCGTSEHIIFSRHKWYIYTQLRKGASNFNQYQKISLYIIFI